MNWNRRILELVLVIAMVAAVTHFLTRSDDRVAASATASPLAVSSAGPKPTFSVQGVRPGTSLEEVEKLLGPSKGDRFNENRQRYLNFGDIDLMEQDGRVTVIYTPKVDLGQDRSIEAGSSRESIQSLLGQPHDPGPASPHRAPDYELYQDGSILLEVTYQGDKAARYSLFQEPTVQSR